VNAKSTYIAVIVVLASLAGCSRGSTGSPSVSRTAASPTVSTHPSATPLTLTGGSWRMTAVSGPAGSMTPSLKGTLVTIVFGADGKVSGRDGCNFFGANYTLRGAALRITGFQTTLIACAEPIMSQATSMFEALRSARSFAIAGDELRLRGADGITLIVFRSSG
jgi:heat shock protein HslJ